jgi:PIN domain nuclease of toxin-antitoxin system
MKQARFTELPLHLRHIATLRALPALHRDPFDRMLVAQARTDELVTVTTDRQIRAYGLQDARCVKS